MRPIRFVLSLLPLFLVLLYTLTAHAAPPQTMNYQGVLKIAAGVPYNGAKKLTFSIYNVATGGTPLWTEIQPTVNIAKGQFSVTLGGGTPAVPLALPFDVPYWLGVTVDPETDEMSPRQPLTSVPYAFRAAVSESITVDGPVTIQTGGQSVLRIEPNATSPNITLGNPGNIAGGNGAFGSTVSGGGSGDSSCIDPATGAPTKSCANKANNYFSTVSGGRSNIASGYHSVVGGGASNTATEQYSTVGGGLLNTASSDSSTVCGGYWNTASGDKSAVGGGSFNIAGGSNSSVAGGLNNVANDFYSMVGGGHSNVAAGRYATVSGGIQNMASASAATVAGGARNAAYGNNSFVAGGADNIASGQWSLAGGLRAMTHSPTRVPHDGAFVFSGSNDFDFHSTANNEFAARATGGVRFVTAIDGAGNPIRTFQIDNSGNVSASGTVTASNVSASGVVSGDGSGLTNITATNVSGIVGIANGGTGATKAGDALLALGAVNKAGDTMTGRLTLPQSGLIVGDNQLVVSKQLVGIGTSTPTSALTVVGVVETSGGIKFRDGTVQITAVQVPAKSDCSGARYEDNGDGTISDCRTGLIWLKNADCPGRLNWDNAVAWVSNLGSGFCGLSDGSYPGFWRMPTPTEWMAMVASARKQGFVNPVLTNSAGTAKWVQGNSFDYVQPNVYWSSSKNTAYAWVIGMYDGFVYWGDKTSSSLYVWPVRAGQ